MKNLLAIAFSFFLMTTSLMAAKLNEPSFGRMGKLKKVFGEFERAQIYDTSAFPARIVGQIISNGDGICTGTLIGPKHVITAAHCIYSQSEEKFYQAIYFAPGRINGQRTPYGVVAATKLYLHKDYINKVADVGYDYAVIELSEAIGDNIGWAGFKVYEPSSDVQHFTQIIGYPGDKEEGTMWGVECPLAVEGGWKATYRCDTYGGMSGSSLRKNDQNDMVVGVHTWGNEFMNGGVMLDQENFDNILSWKQGIVTDDTFVQENTFPPKEDWFNLIATNKCHKKIHVAFHVLNLDKEWQTNGWYSLESGESFIIARTRNTIYYYGAVSSDTSIIWKGDSPISWDGDTYYFIRHDIKRDTWGNAEMQFTCN